MRAYAAAIGLSILVPAVALIVVLATRDPEEHLAEPPVVEPIPVTPTAVESGRGEPATMSIVWSPGRELRSSRQGGLVRELFIGVGSELITGTRIADVDGLSIVGYVAPRPLYRPLRPGTQGDDVALAEDFLVAMGYLAEDRDAIRVDRRLRQAFAQLNQDLGASGVTLDPGLLIWIGTSPLTVASTSVTAGASFPSHGEVIATGPKTVSAVTVVNTDGQPISPADLADKVLVVDDLRYAFDEDGLAAASGNELSQRFPAGPDELNGVLELANPLRLVSVPAGAVVTDEDGTACLLSMERKATEVRVLDGEPGRAYVQPVDDAHQLPDPVLANPHDIIPGARCAS